MACNSSVGGIDDSLLFFFLLLVIIFCMPGFLGGVSDTSDKCRC
jgi:hypothetical protein